MLDLLATVLTGGASGLIGTVISKALGLFEAAQKRKDRALEFEHELKLLDRQAELRAAETESELALVQASAAENIRVASYRHDSEIGNGSQWVVDTLRLVRPSLTLLSMVLLAIIYFTAADIADRVEIIHAVIYIASTSVTWWSGTRDTNKPRK